MFETRINDFTGIRDTGNKPDENRPGLHFQSDLAALQVFRTEGKIYECNRVDKSISSAVPLLRRIPPTVPTDVSNEYGNDFLPPLLTQDQKHASGEPLPV